MRLKIITATAALGAGLALAGGLASATALPGAATTTAASAASAGTLHDVGYRGYCFRWRQVCASRWGWGNWRFRRCLRLHGC